jgi:cysteine desulfurase
LAGHKLYAPKGVGALYIRRGTRLSKLLHGAGHEGDRRAGTENVMGIAGLGAAALLAARHEERLAEHLSTLRDRLHDRLSAGIPDARLNGHPERRLPNTLSISFPGLNAARLLDALEGVAASAGAACHAGQAVGSHVLRAMGVPHDVARGTIRFSTGRATTMDEIDRAADEVIGVVRELREADSESTAKLVPASFSPPPGPCCGRR